MISKKTISPVVAVALLLVTAVVAVVGFQTWFNDYSSQIFTDTETKSSNSVSQTGIDQVIGNILYFRNSGTDTITVTQVEVNGEECYGDGDYTSGVSEIDLYDCMNNLSTTTPDVVVYTNDKIYSKKILVSENFIASFNYPSDQFVSVWDTTLNSSSGSSNQNTIVLPLEASGTYNFDVDWGDGTTETITTYNTANHTYTAPGRYVLKINGTINGWRFVNTGDRLKLLEIRQWGALNVGNNANYFYGASNFDFIGTDSLNLTGTINLGNMFYQATNFNGDLSTWDVSEVTSTLQMFYQATSFNEDISTWNVSNVTTMESMFSGATSFNGDLSTWDVSEVTVMSQMFSGATSFNEDISTWNVSKVGSMYRMFYQATNFNGNLSTWDVGNVTNMQQTFYNADSFNSDISNWDTSQVTDFYRMFYNADSFNSDISNWNVSKADRMDSMFRNADSFNRDISTWNVSAVLDMDYIFNGADIFNQDLSTWDVDQVTSCTSFNTSAAAWLVSNQPDFAGQGSPCTP